MKKLLPCLVLMSAVMLGHSRAEPPAISHDDTFTKEGLFKADVFTLKDTQLALHPDVSLAADQNVLWCGTFQLAWNKAIDLVGERLHFISQPPVVDLLNQQDFTDKDLDAASYVALADFERNNVEDEIRAALEKTFHGAASPELIPKKPQPPPGPDNDSFVAYAYLYKNLAFAHPFAENDPLNFGTQKVANFGFLKNKKQLTDDVFKQVLIYDYKSDNDFIIKLKTKAQGDELILAKVPPDATLQATMTAVLGRIANHPPEIARESDVLAVPKLNFDLRQDFKNLEGLVLQPSTSAHIKSALTVAKAEQLVRFQLNEKGAILKSEAVIVMETGAVARAANFHSMIFDRPFLILMKRTDSNRPYFALWVGNASLLVPAP